MYVKLKSIIHTKGRAKMDICDILKAVDHTLLAPDCTWAQIAALCDEGLEYKTASVCIPASFVKRARERSRELKLCTVIGFPCGYSEYGAKEREAVLALDAGADELDMVINIGALKDGDFSLVRSEIEGLKAVCSDRVLKVIVETCLLSERDKIAVCKIVADSGADFIKTSTGFSTGGATRQDIALFSANLPTRVKIKASGGIATLKDAEDFLNLGASRLGTSRIVKLAREMI